MCKTNAKMIVSEPNEIFNKIKKEDFKQLLEIANQYKPLPVEDLYKSFISDNDMLNCLHKKWEKSVADGNPDYSVYGEDAYMNEVFICWKEYSRRYLLLLKKYLAKENCEVNKEDISSILDLGCGCGFSTIGLKAIFPKAIVSATNLNGTLQHAINVHVTENIDDIYIYDENDTFNLNNINMVFAS